MSGETNSWVKKNWPPRKYKKERKPCMDLILENLAAGQKPFAELMPILYEFYSYRTVQHYLRKLVKRGKIEKVWVRTISAPAYRIKTLAGAPAMESEKVGAE